MNDDVVRRQMLLRLLRPGGYILLSVDFAASISVEYQRFFSRYLFRFASRSLREEGLQCCEIVKISPSWCTIVREHIFTHDVCLSPRAIRPAFYESADASRCFVSEEFESIFAQSYSPRFPYSTLPIFIELMSDDATRCGLRSVPRFFGCLKRSYEDSVVEKLFRASAHITVFPDNFFWSDMLRVPRFIRRAIGQELFHLCAAPSEVTNT